MENFELSYTYSNDEIEDFIQTFSGVHGYLKPNG